MSLDDSLNIKLKRNIDGLGEALQRTDKALHICVLELVWGVWGALGLLRPRIIALEKEEVKDGIYLLCKHSSQGFSNDTDKNTIAHVNYHCTYIGDIEAFLEEKFEFRHILKSIFLTKILKRFLVPSCSKCGSENISQGWVNYYCIDCGHYWPK
ncbi:hypothetical protein [Dapis sp. BLCC M229]|uniref:hypothetical protein n=1 Tax=Dapis sp. BLCC M229 TaxID=3400188 RepID=UPI003CF5B988